MTSQAIQGCTTNRCHPVMPGSSACANTLLHTAVHCDVPQNICGLCTCEIVTVGIGNRAYFLAGLYPLSNVMQAPARRARMRMGSMKY